MEPRKTRSSSRSSLTPVPDKKVKMVSIPSHELAKLQASKPMLVIPQPVLQSHDCLDETIRMAKINPNSYIALGVKEEPMDDYSEYELSCEQPQSSLCFEYDEHQLPNSIPTSEPYIEIEGRRMTRAAIRRQQSSFELPLSYSEDANNNGSSKSKRKANRLSQKSKDTVPDFQPIVLSVCSLAPGFTPDGSPLENSIPNHSLETPTDSSHLSDNNNKMTEGNNNNQKDFGEKIKESNSVSTFMNSEILSDVQSTESVIRSEPTPSLSDKSDSQSPPPEPDIVRKKKTVTKSSHKSSPQAVTFENSLNDTPSNSSECESEKHASPTKRKLRQRVSLPEPVTQAEPLYKKKTAERSSLSNDSSQEITQQSEEKTQIDDEEQEDENDARVHEVDSDNYDPETSSEEESDDEEPEAEEPSSTPKLWAVNEEERSTLTCGVCEKKFSRVSILTAHKKKHFDPKVYNCTHCNKVFSSESSYKHHIAYSGLAPFKCDRCQKSYYTEQKAEAHRATCQGKNTERKYHCEDCGRSYVMLCSLRTHIRERHSDFKPVKNLCCDLCDKRFRHKKYLELHMYSHSSEKKFECDICHRKYKSGDILRHHVRMVHKNLPRVQCEICQKEVSRVSLKAHLNRHREKEEEAEERDRHLLNLTLSQDTNAPFCRICSKYFESDKLLEMHACEGKEGTFTCSYCSTSFTSADELVKHICDGIDNTKSRNTSKVYKCVFCLREYSCHTPWLYHVRHHTNDKPYPCLQCNKSFRLKQGLKVHMRNHTGEKPFKCDQCPAAFKQKPFLLDHMNTHTGNKPYQCQQCLARFSVRSALSTHKRIHRREMKRLADAAD